MAIGPPGAGAATGPVSAKKNRPDGSCSTVALPTTCIYTGVEHHRFLKPGTGELRGGGHLGTPDTHPPSTAAPSSPVPVVYWMRAVQNQPRRLSSPRCQLPQQHLLPQCSCHENDRFQCPRLTWVAQGVA